MTDPSERHSGFVDSVEKIPNSQRPILTHLNADTSWILQLPWKDAPVGRSRFNVLIDPWFKDVQVDFVPWFSRQWHSTRSSVQSIAELNERLSKLETHDGPNSTLCNPNSFNGHNPYIDAAVISHGYTDHCNKDTLLELDSETVILADEAAANTIRSWHYFAVVQELPRLSNKTLDWMRFSTHTLPNWLAIFQIAPSLDLTNTHSAVILCFNLEREESGNPQILEQSEAIVYTPHGLPPESLQILSQASPSIKPLLLIHGMHEVSVGWFGQISESLPYHLKRYLQLFYLDLGALNGLRCWQTCRAKYWVPTHDEIKLGKGLIGWFLRRNVLTLQEALTKQNEKKARRVSDDLSPAEMNCLHFHELGSGSSLVLT